MMPSQKLGIDWPNMAKSMIPPSSGVPPLGSGENPNRNGQQGSEQNSEDCQLQRGRHAFHDKLKGWRTGAQRVAEVERGQSSHITGILFVERPIKA